MKNSYLFFLFILVFFLIFPSNSFGIPSGVSSLSEKEYLLLVMDRNEDLGVLRKEIEAKLFSIRGELASQRTSVGISAEVDRWLNHSRGDRYADLAVSQRIDLGGRYGLQEQDLLLGLRIMESRYANSVNEMLAKASSTYRQAVMAGFNRKMREEVLEHRRQSLEVTREKFDKELVPLLDFLRAQSQVDEGEALLLQARQNYEQNLIEMRALAGQTKVAPLLEVPDIPEIVSRGPGVDYERAWEHRPDVDTLRSSRQQASVRYALAARGLAPFLDLSVGWRGGEDYRSSYVENHQGEVLVTAVLSIPLTDGNKTRNATRAAELAVEKADRELRSKEDGVEKELSLVRERWTRGLELEKVRRRQMRRSSEELEIAEMLYREGLASQLDLLSAQERDQQSRADHLATLQELWLTLAEADRVMGRYGGDLLSNHKE